MSLNWTVKEINDWENVCWIEHEGKDYLNGITESLIFGTIGIGFGSITEENCIDFYNRSIIVADVYGMPINEFPEDSNEIIRRNFTLNEIRQHIGLWTNAENLSDKEFMERMNKAQIRKQKDLESIKK